MMLIQLSSQYRESADMLAERIEYLQTCLCNKGLSETEKLLLRRRLFTLECMRRETIAMSNHLAHYYERGFKRCAQYTI